MKVLLPLIFAVCAVFSCTQKGPDVIHDLKSLQGVRIGMVSGTTHESYVRNDFPDAEQVVYDNATDLILALKNRKISVAAFDTFAWMEISESNPDLTDYEKYWRSEPFGMIFHKSNTDLLGRFNTFLAGLKESGELEELIDKWMNNGDTSEMPDLSGVPRSGEPLKVACTGTTPFFDFIRDGESCGLDIDIVHRFAAYLGRPVEFSLMNFGGLVASTSTGIVDIACSSICITEERAQKVNFSDSYANGYACLLIRKENAPAGKAFMTLDDLSEATVGTLLGSTQDLWFKDTYPDAANAVFNNKADVINALLNDQCDAIVMDEGSSAMVLKENPDLALLETGFCTVDFGVCFRKNSPLLRQFNEFQRKLRESGELDAMAAKWKDTAGTFALKPVEFGQFGGKPLRLGTTLMDIPYSYLIDNKPAGFDIELVSLFARSIKRDVEIVSMDFGGLISGLSSDYIDLAANSIMYTPERGAAVDFAEPYMQLASCAVVKGENLAPSHPNSQKSFDEGPSFIAKACDSFYNNIIKENRWMLILEGLYYTVLISMLSLLFGTLLSVGICAMRMSKRSWISGMAKYYILLVRGIPILVLLMILFYVIFAKLGVSAVTVAIIAFSINFSAFASEIFRSGLEGIDPGQKKAGIAMGFTNFQTFRYIILPQAVKQVLSVFKGEAGGLVKMTSVVGYIAVMDLTKASDIIRSRTFDAFFPLIIITIIYFILTWLLGKALDLLNTSSNK